MKTKEEMVYLVQPLKNWPRNLGQIRVFRTRELALKFIHDVDTRGEYTYLERPVLSETVCPHCGSMVSGLPAYAESSNETRHLP